MISLLDSRSPYRPWRYGFGEAQMGDPVAIVLNTDPPSVMTELGRLGADGRPDRALINWPMSAPSLVDLATLTEMGGFAEDPRAVWVLRGDAAIQMELALTECVYRHDIDLTGEDGRDAVHIHTIDAPARPASAPVVRTERHASYMYGSTPEDWGRPEVPADLPGVLCRRCVQHMQDEDITSLVDFRFARHPKCPRCRVSRTQKAVYGHVLRPLWEPWIDYRGCVRTDQHAWTCGACGLQWC